MIRLALIVLAALMLWTWPAASVEEADAEAKPVAGAEEKALPPSFAPGATVTLALEIRPPEQWQLNYLVPLRLEFDEEYLKEAPFTVKQAVWDFTLKSYMPRYTAEIPLTLNTDLADGALTIPLKLMGSICESSGEMCTFCIENVTVKLEVLSVAPPDTENQALSTGIAQHSHRLSLP
jgi:hypothetical protein